MSNLHTFAYRQRCCDILMKSSARCYFTELVSLSFTVTVPMNKNYLPLILKMIFFLKSTKICFTTFIFLIIYFSSSSRFFVVYWLIPGAIFVLNEKVFLQHNQKEVQKKTPIIPYIHYFVSFSSCWNNVLYTLYQVRFLLKLESYTENGSKCTKTICPWILEKKYH